MPKILVAFAVAVLLFAGCSSDSDDNNTPSSPADLPGGVSLVAPLPDSLITIGYTWVVNDSTTPCNWHLEKSDTTFALLTVATDIPSGIDSAQIFRSSWTANAFYAQGPPFAALTTTFTVPLFLGYPAYQTSLPTDTFSNWYCVRVTARDRSHWVSSAVYIKTIYAVDPPLTTVTPPPDLQEIHEDPSVYQSGGRMLFWQWCAPSPDVSLYLTYLRIGEDGPVSVDTTMLSGHAYHLSGYTYNYLPLTDYALWMVAANAYGLSPVSDTLRITTREPALPFNQQAHVIYPSGCVEISYSLERLCDSVLIQRRDPATAWTTIATISGNSGTGGATDAAPAPGHDYYYRVGAEFSNGIWWSTDSLHVSVG